MRKFEGYYKGVNLGGWLSQCIHGKKHYVEGSKILGETMSMSFKILRLKTMGSDLFDAVFTEAVKIAEERDVPLYCGEYGGKTDFLIGQSVLAFPKITRYIAAMIIRCIITKYYFIKILLHLPGFRTFEAHDAMFLNDFSQIRRRYS